LSGLQKNALSRVVLDHEELAERAGGNIARGQVSMLWKSLSVYRHGSRCHSQAVGRSTSDLLLEPARFSSRISSEERSRPGSICRGTGTERMRGRAAQEMGDRNGARRHDSVRDRKSMSLECFTLKFFPAEQAGGAAMLKAFEGPYGHTGIKFIPTGGIHPANMRSYLERHIPSSPLGGS